MRIVATGQVPRNLRRAASNEKSFAVNFFSREEKRVEYVRRRLDAIKEGGGAEGEAAVPPPAEVKEGEPTEEEKAEAAFKEMELKFLEEMELNIEEPAPAEVS